MRANFKLGFQIFRAFVGTVMLCAAATVSAGSIPVCAVIDPSTLPTAGSCQRRFASADPDVLYAFADAKIKAGDFLEAQSALDCVARQFIGKNDPLSQYEWVRRRGVLAYQDQRIDIALGHFECALRMAEKRGDRAATAKQHKNVGSALRRIGDYQGAQRNLERGLQMMREDGDPAIGGMLSNIADIYRETEDPAKAERYYLEAEAAFRLKGDTVEAAHVLNSLGLLALERKDYTTASGMLETALREVQSKKDFRYQLSFYGVLAKIAIARGDVQGAALHAANGLAVADANKLPIPVVLNLQAARVDRLQGRQDAAIRRLETALKKPLSNADRAELYEELAFMHGESGHNADAIDNYRNAHEAVEKLLRAQSDQQLGWLRARFESDEDERTIAALRQRTLLLWLAVASTLAVLLALSLIFVRHQQRARIEDAMRRARYEEMLARYRRETDALGEDRDRLQTLFDSRSDALCLLDADGMLLTVNRAACALLGGERERFVGRALTTFFSDSDAGVLMVALERMEDAVAHTMNVSSPTDGAELRVELVPWEHGDGLIVMQLRRCSDIATVTAEAPISTPLPVAAERSVSDEHDADDGLDTSDAANVPVPEFAAAIALASDDDARADFRRALVELMLAAIEAWERSTGQNRIELADRSRIWCINIDDGRLRTRAMERYMSLTKLPRNPRWRDVLRSAYYVLGQCQLDPTVRDELQRRVDTVLAYARRTALA
ncbi:MAG: tetratricopeptide repeat protein [Lysobacter sp.]|nr:tetratricopeptide repeat protein [Lysobacter sp.]